MEVMKGTHVLTVAICCEHSCHLRRVLHGLQGQVGISALLGAHVSTNTILCSECCGYG